MKANKTFNVLVNKLIEHAWLMLLLCSLINTFHIIIMTIVCRNKRFQANNPIITTALSNNQKGGDVFGANNRKVYFLWLPQPKTKVMPMVMVKLIFLWLLFPCVCLLLRFYRIIFHGLKCCKFIFLCVKLLAFVRKEGVKWKSSMGFLWPCGVCEDFREICVSLISRCVVIFI